MKKSTSVGRAAGASYNVVRMPWAITGGPLDHAEPGYDGRGWLWEIRQGDEYRRVFVQISGSALASSRGLAGETERAIATRGASEVEKVLAEDDPPRMIGCSTLGCGPMVP